MAAVDDAPLSGGPVGSLAKRRHVPGEPGLWVLLLGDMALFTTLFAAYLYQRARDVPYFDASQDHLNRTLGAVNTLVLLTSSILVVFALRALRDERTWPTASRLTLAGVGVGACFVVVKALEYQQKFAAGLTPTAGPVYLWYYVITGLHLGHVIVGLIVLTALSRLVRKQRPSSTVRTFFEGGACFWHLVDLLWIVIFPLIYLVR
ncbi:cytochrome c oxidase subunit 3 [Mycobacterium syngnathidarum]